MFEKHCKDDARMLAFTEAGIESSFVNNIYERYSDYNCKDKLTSVKMHTLNGTIVARASTAYQPQGALGRICISKPTKKGMILWMCHISIL